MRWSGALDPHSLQVMGKSGGGAFKLHADVRTKWKHLRTKWKHPRTIWEQAWL